MLVSLSVSVNRRGISNFDTDTIWPVSQKSYGFMVFYKLMFWFMTFFVVYVWQSVNFVLALVNRSKTVETCNLANPSQELKSAENANDTVKGYTILGLNTGETYGLANCDQAVEAGVVGLAVLLFIGSIFMVCMRLYKRKTMTF